DGTGYPKLSAEYVVSANPDVVVLADIRCCGQSLRTVAARPGWRNVSAVRTGTVVRIDDSIASRWGPRVVNFVRAVAARTWLAAAALFLVVALLTGALVGPVHIGLLDALESVVARLPFVHLRS